jgi:hypothetical protein
MVLALQFYTLRSAVLERMGTRGLDLLPPPLPPQSSYVRQCVAQRGKRIARVPNAICVCGLGCLQRTNGPDTQPRVQLLEQCHGNSITDIPGTARSTVVSSPPCEVGPVVTG